MEENQTRSKENEDLGMKMNILKTELEATQEKLNNLVKANQELEQELAQLNSQIPQSTEDENNEIEATLSAFFGDDSPLQFPAQWARIMSINPWRKQRAPAPAPVELRQVPQLLELFSSLVKTNAQNSAGNSEFKAKVKKIGEWLIEEVKAATPENIIEVEDFVNWLDEVLAVLAFDKAMPKRFPQWPKRKVEALREAASTYRDIKSIENEGFSFEDNPLEEMRVALPRLISLQNRLEQCTSNMERIRNFNNLKDIQIPYDWLDSDLRTKMNLISLRLAKKYMARVTRELQSNQTPQSCNTFWLAVRFTQRVHQYAGGFDSEAIMAFEELTKVGQGTQRQL